MQEWNHMKLVFKPQWYETRKQLQESYKNYKHIEMKQHVAEMLGHSYWEIEEIMREIMYRDKWK